MLYFCKDRFNSVRWNGSEKSIFSFVLLSMFFIYLGLFSIDDYPDEASLVIVNDEIKGVVERSDSEKVHEYIDEYKKEEEAKSPYKVKLKDDLLFEDIDGSLIGEEYPEELLYDDEQLGELKEKIVSSLNFSVKGYAVQVKGEEEELVILQEKDIAFSVLKEVKETYYKEFEEKDEVKLEEVSIKEDIDIYLTETSPSEIKDKQEAVDYILQGENKIKTHEIEKGESLSVIASNYDTTVEKLRKANFGPEAEDDAIIRPGEELQLEKTEELLTLEASMKIKNEKEIPYSTRYENDNTLWQGETRVLNSGEPGKKTIEYMVKKENDTEIKKEKLSEEMLKSPEDEVVARGTANRPTDSKGEFIWPLNPSSGKITSPYGMRNGDFHRGVDYGAPQGTPIRAAKQGVVTFSGHRGTYGNLIIIEHSGGYETYYAHNSVNWVEAGESVAQGQEIGLVGATGRATGPHLHFELHKNGRHVNPTNYFTP